MIRVLRITFPRECLCKSQLLNVNESLFNLTLFTTFWKETSFYLNKFFSSANYISCVLSDKSLDILSSSQRIKDAQLKAKSAFINYSSDQHPRQLRLGWSTHARVTFLKNRKDSIRVIWFLTFLFTTLECMYKKLFKLSTNIKKVKSTGSADLHAFKKAQNRICFTKSCVK